MLNRFDSVEHAVAVTPGAVTDVLPGGTTVGLHVDVGGTLRVVFKSGAVVQFATVLSGQMLHWRVKQVVQGDGGAAGTSATVQALY